MPGFTAPRRRLLARARTASMVADMRMEAARRTSGDARRENVRLARQAAREARLLAGEASMLDADPGLNLVVLTFLRAHRRPTVKIVLTTSDVNYSPS